MERILKENRDIITPDKLRVRNWHLSLFHWNYDTLTLSFDGETIYYGNSSLKHPIIHMKLKNNDLFDFRYWYNENLICCWSYDENTVDVLKKIKYAYENNKIKKIESLEDKRFYYYTKDTKFFDVNTVDIIFEQNINDKKYIVKCKFDELDNVTEMSSNNHLRQYHVMPPQLKFQELSNNKQLMSERQYYIQEGQKAWVAKHGDIDPAYYHLLMYEE